MNLTVHCCCSFVEEAWLCISFKVVFLDVCYLIVVIVIDTVEARVLFTLRHGCASLLCERHLHSANGGTEIVGNR